MYAIIKAKKIEFFKLVLLIIIGQIFLVISAIINANALNELIAMNWKNFLFQEVILMCVWGGVIFFDWLEKNYRTIVIQDLNIEIRKGIAKNISRLSYQAYYEKSVNSYVSWLNNDIQLINKNGFEMLFLVIKGLTGTLFSVITLTKYHWSLPLITFLSVGFMLAIPRAFNSNMKEVSLKTTLQNEEFLKKAENTLNGFSVLSSLNLLRVVPERILEASRELKKTAVKQTKVEALVGAIGFSGNIFFQILITIFTGYLAFIGVVSIGTIEATGALTAIIFTTLGSLSSQLVAINGTRPIFDKFEYINQSEESQFAKKNLLEINTEDDLFVAKKLSCQYDGQKVLNNITFTFKRKGKYLLLGKSGSGKSTLLKILNGFIRDYDGSIKLYNQEMKAIDEKEIIHHVLLLEQQPYLFSGSLRDNILLGECFSDEEIRESLEKVGLLVELNRSNFLDYQVGENGRLLSGGQRQRVALARGLIRNRKIILVDEGTSAVDKETATEIEQNLLEQNDLTIIIVTHSPNPKLREYFTKIIDFPDELL